MFWFFAGSTHWYVPCTTARDGVRAPRSQATGRPSTRHSAVLLPSGTLLVVGGKDPNVRHLNTTETLDPVTQTWSAGPSRPTTLTGGALLALTSGKVLLVGGYYRDQSESLATSSLFIEAPNRWQDIGPLQLGRFGQTVTPLLDGRFPAAGGMDSNGYVTATAELSR